MEFAAMELAYTHIAYFSESQFSCGMLINLAHPVVFCTIKRETLSLSLSLSLSSGEIGSFDRGFWMLCLPWLR